MAKGKLQKLVGSWILVVGTLLTAACTAPLQDVTDVPINRYDGKALTMANMERSIREAA